MSDTPEVMTPDQAAIYLGITTSSMKKRLDRRQIPFVKVGRLRRLRKTDLDSWLERNAKGVHA